MYAELPSGRVTLITSKSFAFNNCGNKTFMTNSVDPDQTAHVGEL